MKKAIGTLLAFGFYIFMMGQSSIGDVCNKVKEGVFYFYPKNDKNGYIITREKNTQKEVNLFKGDTTLWRVEWKSACNFNLKFITKSKPLSDFEKRYYNAHLVVVNILEVTTEFYVYKSGIDSIENRHSIIDTIWFKPRVN
jgi:hypothetical protein